jgi:hypothetical protein
MPSRNAEAAALVPRSTACGSSKQSTLMTIGLYSEPGRGVPAVDPLLIRPLQGRNLTRPEASRLAEA